MTLTVPSKPKQTHRPSRARPDRSRHPAERSPRHRARHDQPLLGHYTDWQGNAREVLAREGAAGSMLVIDRDARTRGDRRLVAHLASDEPAENAELVARRYIEDLGRERYRCRAVTDQDIRTVPFADEEAELQETSNLATAEPLEGRGRLYRLELLDTGMSIPELRWCRLASSPPRGEPPQIVSMREAIGWLESYEPLRAITRSMLSRRDFDGDVSTTVLRAELARVQNSPIVLNRGLREAALASIQRHQLSMSEIAIRCGRVKRDRRGNVSGETSWLARRLGLLPEGGQGAPTPWIHSDVLALIARRGLGISPREVELA